MLTKELVERIAEQSGLKKRQVEQLLSANNAIIRESLMSGQAVQLQGLGSFEVKTRSERVIIHPQTGERNVVPAKNQLVFRPAISVKEELKRI